MSLLSLFGKSPILYEAFSHEEELHQFCTEKMKERREKPFTSTGFAKYG